MFRNPGPHGGGGVFLHHGHDHDGWFIAAFVIHTLLWVALLALLFYLVRHLVSRPGGLGGGFPGPGGRRHPIIDELDARYARGEVSREDWVQRRTDLGAFHATGALPPPVNPFGPAPGFGSGPAVPATPGGRAPSPGAAVTPAGAPQSTAPVVPTAPPPSGRRGPTPPAA